MAKRIGIVLALCATLAIATKPHFSEEFARSHNSFHGSHNSKQWPGNGFHNFNAPHNLGNWPKFGSHNPHASHNLNTYNWPSDYPSSEERKIYGFPRPQSQNNLNDMKYLPWYPKRPYTTEKWEYHNFPQPYVYHGFPQGHTSKQFAPTVVNQNWVHKVNRPDWYNPHFPQIPYQANGINPQMPLPVNGVFEDMSKRRPLFTPIYPYHFYPYAHPSNNEEEFQTIEARNRNTRDSDEDSSEILNQRHGYEYHHHESHNPNWNGDSDNEEKPFYPGPHFNPFPNTPENDDHFPPNDAQPYEHPPPSPLDSFIIIDVDGDKHFNIPHILEIIDQWLQEHVKPYHPHQKPDDDYSEEIEGSGDEDIIPLSGAANIPLSE